MCFLLNKERIKQIEELRDRFPYDIGHIRTIFDKGTDFANSKDKIKVAEEQLDTLRVVEMIIDLGRPIKIDGDLHNKIKALLE